MRDSDGKLWSTQCINDQGRKSFAKDSRMQGLFYMMGDPESSRMMIAEGYSTGATLHHATGLPVAICFSSGNMPAVAQALRERYPDKTLYLAGDNDHHLEAKGKPNVGLEKAREAARLTNGVPLLPSFAPGDPGTDWNDIFQRGGLDTLHRELKTAKIIGEREKQLAEIARERENREIPQQHKHSQEQEEPQQEKALSMSGGRSLSL